MDYIWVLLLFGVYFPFMRRDGEDQRLSFRIADYLSTLRMQAFEKLQVKQRIEFVCSVIFLNQAYRYRVGYTW